MADSRTQVRDTASAAMSRSHRPARPIGRLAVDVGAGNFLGDTRIRLLEAIDEYGSISQAAKAVPLSYKAAWDAVSAMNNLAEQPLVERTTGGRQGGGTRLTGYARRLVAMYRAMEQEYQATLEKLWQRMNESGGDVAQFRALLRRLSLKTSARNQFVGPITALRDGGVSYEVCLRLDAASELIATITREAAEGMDLRIGMELHALVNASAIVIVTGGGGRLTARNQLRGRVVQVHAGPVDCEVTLELPGGLSVTAVVTHDSLRHLDLAIGQDACAVFKASSVIVASFA